MTITQTIEIPPSRRLTIDVPREVPEGTVTLTFTPAQGKEPQQPQTTGSPESLEQITAELRELCNDSSLTTADLLEMGREDLAQEEAKYQRLFSNTEALL